MIKKFSFLPLQAYLTAVGAWFFAFGIQSILFPSLVIFELKENADILGTAQAALVAPALFFLIPAGWIADYGNMRKILWRFYLFACLPTFSLIMFFQFQILNLPFLYLYAILMGSINALTLPTRDAALNPVLHHHKQKIQQKNRQKQRRVPELQKAVILAQSIQFAFQIIGMLSAMYAKVIWMLFFQLCAFLTAAFSAYHIPQLRQKHFKNDYQKKSYFILLTDRVLIGMVCMMFSVGVFAIGGGFLVMIPIMIRDVFQGSYFLLSITSSAFWIGAFISVIALLPYKNIKRPGRLLLVFQILGILFYMSLAKSSSFFLFLALIIAWGLCAGVVTAMGRFILQHRISRDKLGRVMALYQLGFVGGAPIGALLFGYVSHYFGLSTSILMASLAYALSICILLFTTPLWSLESGRKSC